MDLYPPARALRHEEESGGVLIRSTSSSPIFSRPIVARPIASRPTLSRPIAKPPIAAAPTASAPTAKAPVELAGRTSGLKNAIPRR